MAKIELSEEILQLSSKLTHLQRKLVLALVQDNLSQRQAYIKAGGTAKTEASQDAAAARMLSDVKVKSFYDALINTRISQAILTREEAMEILSLNAKTAKKCKDQHTAIKQLADMEAWNAPKRVEHTGKDGEAIEVTQIERVIV